MTTAPATWEFSQKFTAQFQATRTELQSQIKAAGAGPTAAVLQDLSAGVARLSKTLLDATGSLPKYDQGLYENQVKELETEIESLRTSSSSKPRFSFKRKPQASTPTATPPPIVPSDPSVQPGPSVESSGNSSATSAAQRNLTLESQQYSYLDASALAVPSESSTPDLSISDLSYCIVNLLPHFNKSLLKAPFGAYHIRRLTNCVVLLPMCPGSALVHELKNCVVALGCHQFRMHNSTSTDIYLDITSNPIIEGCQRIRFGMYPSKLNPELLGKEPLPSLTVQDFSHIRSTPSPNFVLMPDKLAVESLNWPVERVEGKEEIGRALEAVLPGLNVSDPRS